VFRATDDGVLPAGTNNSDTVCTQAAQLDIACELVSYDGASHSIEVRTRDVMRRSSDFMADQVLEPQGYFDGTTDPGCTVTGTDRSEVLAGTSGDDVICALGGNDMVGGLGGDDTILGGQGNDLLIGGPGDDMLDGEAGWDLLLGGPGTDTCSGEMRLSCSPPRQDGARSPPNS
jgi:Ca2+-binding RTX toxin-like protein